MSLTKASLYPFERGNKAAADGSVFICVHLLWLARTLFRIMNNEHLDGREKLS